MNRNQLQQILTRYVPQGTVEYAADLLVRHKIQLYIKKPRVSKYGDYRPPGPGEDHIITLNKDLNPFAFLITFMHEVAHLLNHETHAGRVLPHGSEWKMQFRQVSAPVFENNVLPADVNRALARYLSNPKASSCSDPFLFRTLRNYDPKPPVLVEDIPMKTQFRLKDGRTFIKLFKNRTRFTCQEITTGRTYFIPGIVPCELVV